MIKFYFKYIFCGILIAISIIGFTSVYVSYKLTNAENKVYVKYEPSSYSVNDNDNSDFVQSVDRARKSVVEINSFMDNATGAGSGVIYATDDKVTYIVTNFHVIENAKKFRVILYDGTTIDDVQLVGGDELEDIAVLLIKGGDYSVATLRQLKSDSSIKLGETVFAIGNPLGKLGGSVTKGIISCLNREIKVENQIMNLMQTDVAINSGNSGGGLFDVNGDLVGIVNAKVSATGVEGIAFAISIDNASSVANEIIKNHKHNMELVVTSVGYVKGRVDLGFDVSYTALVSGFFTFETALYVTSINQKSNAYKNGVRQYDKVVGCKYLSHNYDFETIEDYLSFINQIKVGDEVVMKIKRNGTIIECSATAIQKVYSI